MKFSDYKYERPNYEEIKEKVSKLIKDFEEANLANEQLDIIDEINIIRNDISTQLNIASIRHSINTKDEFYEEENNYWVTKLLQ